MQGYLFIVLSTPFLGGVCSLKMSVFGGVSSLKISFLEGVLPLEVPIALCRFFNSCTVSK